MDVVDHNAYTSATFTNPSWLIEMLTFQFQYTLAWNQRKWLFVSRSSYLLTEVAGEACVSVSDTP